MRVYSYSEARQQLATVLKQAESTGKVIIRRKDGSSFALIPEKVTASPFALLFPHGNKHLYPHGIPKHPAQIYMILRNLAIFLFIRIYGPNRGLLGICSVCVWPSMPSCGFSSSPSGAAMRPPSSLDL